MTRRRVIGSVQLAGNRYVYVGRESHVLASNVRAVRKGRPYIHMQSGMIYVCRMVN